MWYNHKFFKFGSAVLLILLIIFMLGQIDFFLEPFRKLIASIFTPLLISTLLYYVLRPLVNLLEKIRIRRTFGILLSFAAVLVLFTVLSTYTSTVIVEQFNQLLKDLPTFEITWEKTLSFLNSDWLEALPLDKFQDKLIEVLNSVPENLKTIFLGIVSTVTNIGTLIFMIPFILFYFLKDDKYFLSNVVSHVPKKYRDNADKIIKDVDTTLSSYITGQMLIALFVGIMMFGGYLIIGIKYSLLLGIFAMISSLIPFFGPTIGIIPALILSLGTNDLLMFIKVIVVMIVVQQIDNNFISPYIMGQRLNVHPVTVMLLITVGASLYGFLGLFLVVPLYAAAKVSAKHFYEIYRKYTLKETCAK